MKVSSETNYLKIKPFERYSLHSEINKIFNFARKWKNKDTIIYERCYAFYHILKKNRRNIRKIVKTIFKLI